MDLSWLITLFLGFVLIYIMYWLATLNMNYWKNRGVPYIKGPLPFVGNSLPIFQQKQSMSEFALDVYNEFKNEKFFGMLTLQNPVFMPRDPELINLILIKNFNNFHDRMYPKNVSDIISDGLPNITGVRWRNLRYKLTPTFTSGKLKMMFNSIKESSDEIVLYIKEQKQNNKETEIELKDLMFKFMINVIGDVAFGIKINALKETQGLTKMFLDSTNSFFTPSTKQLIRLVIAITYPKLDRILKLNLIDSDTSKFFNDLVKDVIKQRKETGTRRNDFLQLMLDHQEKEQNNGGQEQTYEVEEPEDIELLKQLKDMPLLTDKTKQEETAEIFTDNSIAAQTFTFISGGSDTTSNILTFALYELSLNQQIQRQLQREIDDTLKNHAFNYLALKRMTYLEQVLYEVMRKYPPLAVVGRICTEEFHVPGTSVKLEKGIQVQIPVIGLHYDPQYFPDPETFNPDRFQDMEAIPKGVYLPFGGGPRMCIATRLAMLEMKILLATLLSTFNLTLNEKTEVPLKMKKNSMILKAESGIFINFEERNPFK